MKVFKLRGKVSTYGLQIAHQAINKDMSFDDLLPFQKEMVSKSFTDIQNKFNKLNLYKLEKEYADVCDIIRLTQVRVYIESNDSGKYDDILPNLIAMKNIIKSAKTFNKKDNSHIWLKDILKNVSIFEASTVKSIFKSNKINIFISEGHLNLTLKINKFQSILHSLELKFSEENGFYL